jgi:hypothetical protein
MTRPGPGLRRLRSRRRHRSCRRWRRIERVAEILERFFLADQRLTTELLGELGRCSAADLVKLFGGPVPPATAAPAYGPTPAADVSTVDTPPADEPAAGPVWSKPGAEEPIRRHELRWDANGNCLNPRRSDFSRLRPEMPRGSHWSR